MVITRNRRDELLRTLRRLERLPDRARVLRRDAYLEVGGYSGEERLLSLDLAAAGWEQCYVEDVVAHHQPSPVRDDWPDRWAHYRRNDTLTAWMLLPLRRALAETAQLLGDAVREEAARREVSRLARLLWPAWPERRPVERQLGDRPHRQPAGVSRRASWHGRASAAAMGFMAWRTGR